MLCQKCGKHPATVHFTNLINGLKVEYYLCDYCASQSSLGQLELQDLISGFFGMPIRQGGETLQCDFCHATLTQIKKQGKAGCAHCYQVFASYLDPIIRQVHGGDMHVGKKPAYIVTTEVSTKETIKSSKMEELQEQMKRAVELEHYEEAARLRDEIAMLQKKGETE